MDVYVIYNNDIIRIRIKADNKLKVFYKPTIEVFGVEIFFFNNIGYKIFFGRVRR